MAEGWARALAREMAPGLEIEVSSAGIEAHGLNPRAVRCMQGHGIDISQQQSTVLTDTMLQSVDLLVSVCSHADANCPLLPPGVTRRHMPFDDPARAKGDEAEITACFDAVSLAIKHDVAALLTELVAAQSARAHG